MLFAADSLISLRLAVGGRLHLYRLPMLYRHIITMFVGAATTTTDALPSLCWRMLCRRCAGGCFAAPASLVWRMLCRPRYSYSDGCFAVMVATCWSSSMDALPSWGYSGGCLATL